MNKDLKVLGIGVLLIGLAVAWWFLVAGQSQKTADKTQGSEDGQNIERKNMSIENKGEEWIMESKIEEQKIREFIDSLPEISFEELGYKQMDMANWNIYKNEKLGFEVKYPQSWTFTEGYKALKPRGTSKDIVSVIFNAPETIPGGGVWGVAFLDSTINTLRKEIKNIGEQFDDKVEKRNSIKFYGRKCALISVESSQNKWSSRNIFCVYNKKIFKIYLDKRGYFQGFRFLK